MKESQETSSKGEELPRNPPKGPLSFLSGSITSLLFGWLSLKLSQSIVIYFELHKTNYSSVIAQNIASAFKTLVVGMCFLGTFTFGFIGLGLFLVFLRTLFAGNTGNNNELS